MPIPRIIHFTIPETPSEEQLKNIDVVRKLHPEWRIEVWQDPIDQADFKLSKYWAKVNSGAQLADLIRLEVVFRHGGFYLDSDIALRKSLDALRAYPFVIASQDGNVLTNAFFGAEPQSPVLKHLLDNLDEYEVDWTLAPSLTTGPKFFSRELKWRPDVTVIPRETFYPYNWNERARSARSWTYGTHLWRYSWSSITGERRVLRGMIRGARRRSQVFRRWLLTSARDSLVMLRHLLRVDYPQPYSASGVICAQTVHGPKIYLLGEDASVTPEIALRGTHEFREERFVKRVVRPGDWVIDIGANVGIFSLLCAQNVGPFGRLFCYEPNPLPAGLLKNSLVMNWLHERADVRQKALGWENCVRRLRFTRGRLGDATLAAQDDAGTFDRTVSLIGSEQEIEVDVSTLDDEFPVDLPIRLLKIDAEGFEHHILRGGSRLLEKHCVDILMLECLQEVHGKDWSKFISELEKIIRYGYRPYTLSWSSKLKETTLFRILYGDHGKNVVFVSDDAKQTIRELS